MKKLLILLFLFTSSVSFSQVNMCIKSNKLDSLIWIKINEYRESKGVKVFETFSYSDIRDFSYIRTHKNSKLNLIEHSIGGFDVYNCECIYSNVRTGPNSLLEIINNSDYEKLADDVLHAWINSEPHELGISCKYYTKSTVTSIITLNYTTNQYRLDVSYHAAE
jgi:hypothetical protein